MNVLMLLRSELRRSAAVLAGIAAVLALSLSISIATGMTDRMLRHASAQAPTGSIFSSEPRPAPRPFCSAPSSCVTNPFPSCHSPS